MGAIVDAIVGGLGVTSSNASTMRDTGQGYDFAVGGLGFRVAVTDENPYERATAQFRKEQFDTSEDYGDQSLVGFWTRGQFSFHKGEGTTYYEIGDDADLTNTYSEGYGVDPWTPGETVLSRSLTELTAPAVKSLAIARDLATSPGNEMYLLVTDGTLRAGDVAGADWGTTVLRTPATTTVGSVTSLTNDSWSVYASVGNVVESFGPTDATGTVLWTVTGATTLHGVWHAKQRLWLVDESGRWYMVSTTGGSVATTASDFTIPGGGPLEQNADSWALCETPSAVLFGLDNKVWRVSVDLQAATPVPSQPVLVADLPVDETISHLHYALGHVVIATSRGVRLAIENGDNLIYGPALAADSDFSAANGAGTRSTRVLVPGTKDGVNAVYAIDLSGVDGNLRAPWTREHPLPGGALTYAGIVNATEFGMPIWHSDGTTLYRTAEAGGTVAEGWVQTGIHRFNTLESKKFHSVMVKVGGGSGTVTVSKVVDGATVSLITIDVSLDHDEIITLRMDEPTESVALKFTLTGAAVLRGYQLRALPAPRRQRMIRIPLLVQDVERRGTTRAMGYSGSAWDRLQRLEDMEQSSGTFVFQDFRSGENGTCFIESVEFRGTTPPGKQGDGFGGVVWLTLRKL